MSHYFLDTPTCCDRPVRAVREPSHKLPRTVRLRWPQAAAQAAVISMLPRAWADGIALPYLQDILNMHPFTTMAEYAEDHLLSIDGELGPASCRTPSS